MLKPGSFDAHKNTTALMIVMLGCSETNIEISGVGMKTVESNDCREVLRNDGDANSVLATM